MWLSEQRKAPSEGETAVELGVVTLEGEKPGVYLSGERRDLPVVGPGGYCWRPFAGQQVLVLKAGVEGERPCVAGTFCAEMEELGPGDVGIYAGRSAVVLRSGGRLDLRGEVRLNGVALEELFEPKKQGDGGV